MEVGVARAYFADAMLAHQHGRMYIVQDAAFEMRQFVNECCQRFAMT